MPQDFDMDDFYSAESIAEWKQIIGDHLHYHFGYFTKQEDFETGLRQTVKNFYPYIEPNSTVLDAGCGWGGPATMLKQDLNCQIQGITISKVQADYCRSLGLNVWQRDLEAEDTIEGHYDVAFLLESLSHIRDKEGLLRRLRERAKRVIISVHCVQDDYSSNRYTFDDSMVFCSVTELKTYLKNTNWEIQMIRNRRIQSMPTIIFWHRFLQKIYGDKRPPGHIGFLQDLVNEAMKNPSLWAWTYPLMDVVAD